MKINELNIMLGKCYNSKDFCAIKGYLTENVWYESFDCFYKIDGADDVIEVLNKSIKDNTSAYKGYYRYKSLLWWHLREVVVICDSKSLQPQKMLRVTKKRRKTTLIEGLEAKDYSITRGELIKEYISQKL